MMNELDKAVRFLKGIWPKVAGKNLEYAPYFVGNFTRSLHKENSPYCVYNNPICNEEEFEARAKEKGWVNGLKWGQIYWNLRNKPDLPDDIIAHAFNSNLDLGEKKVGDKHRSWDLITSFKITDERYKPIDETQPTGWHERGELPPVGVECEVYHAITKDWVKAEILKTRTNEAGTVAACMDDDFKLFWSADFRAIKTDRDKFIEAAAEVSGFILCKCFGKLFDAGFKAPNNID